MAKYTILGMMREQDPATQSILISVAFRNNETDEDDYFTRSFYAGHMQHKQEFQYDLCEYAEQFAGSELAYRLKRYLITNANPWSGTMKVETFNYATNEPFLWSGIAGKDMMPEFKMVTKKKISFTGPYDNGGLIAPVQVNVNSGAPNGVNSLPGLKVVVKHPGEKCSLYSDGAQLKSMIIHLNDQHKWTREKIADWLDEISDPTGETGPDLRFGAESAKVEPEPVNPCAEVKSDHAFKPLGWTYYVDQEQLYPKGTEAYVAPKLDEMHMHIELKNVSPEIIKLMTGESNEQD